MGSARLRKTNVGQAAGFVASRLAEELRWRLEFFNT